MNKYNQKKYKDKKNKKEEETSLVYKPKKSVRERIAWLQDRWEQMDSAYTKKHLGDLFDKIERQYLPHEFSKTGLQKWQNKTAKNIAFTKVQTALSILIDQNPERQLFAKTKKGEGKLPLWKSLIDYTDDVGNSREQWKDFVFDLSLYGTALGQEYWRYEDRMVTMAGEEKKIIDFNNPYWKELPIRDVRVDEKARSWDPKSENYPRDWFKRMVMDFEDFKRRYPEARYPKAKYVRSGGDTEDKRERKTVMDVGKDQIEVLYYESWVDDKCSVLANGVLVKDIPLPFRHKKLSLFGANFWKRSTEDVYGLGIPEVIEGDEILIDKINNTNIDQVLLDIYKVLIIGMGEELEDEELILEPNKIIRLKNPDVAKWISSGEKTGTYASKLQARQAIEDTKEDIDEKTGITKQLAGALMGKTATETAINREAGLRRLKTPLDAIEGAMEWQSKLRISMIKQVYELPVGNKEFKTKGLLGILQTRKTPEYRTIRLGVQEQKEKGTYAQSDRSSYIEITPETLFEEPDIKIKHLSTIPASKELEKQKVIQAFSLNSSLPYTDIFKAQKRLNKGLGEDPDDWMMDEKDIVKMQKDAQGFTTGQQEGGNVNTERVARGTDEGVAEVPIQQKQGGVFSKVGEKISGLFGK